MATLTGAAQLVLLGSYTPDTTSTEVTIYTVDGQKYEFIDDFVPGSDYLVVADGTSRVFLNDTAGSSIIVGNDNVYIHADNTSGDNRIIVGNGNNVVLLSDGDDAVRLGQGNNLIDTGAGNDTITAGNGNNTITGGDGSDVVRVGNGNNIIDTSGIAGTDNDFVIIGSGNNSISTGADNDVVIVRGTGSGTNRIDAGAGNDTIGLATGLGVDTIVKGAASDADRVTGFNALLQDKIDANGAGAGYTLATLAGNAVITFADGSSVTLVGVDVANVDPTDFINL